MLFVEVHATMRCLARNTPNVAYFHDSCGRAWKGLLVWEQVVVELSQKAVYMRSAKRPAFTGSYGFGYSANLDLA